MADKIVSVAQSGIRAVSAAEMRATACNGDLLFCAGRNLIDKGIQCVTGGCYSHVLQIWKPMFIDQPLTIEATITHGVHVGLLDYYLSRYDGDLVLARRHVCDGNDVAAAINAGIALVDDPYNVGEEAQILCHKLIPWIEPQCGKGQYFCSALVNHMAMATAHPFAWAGPGDPTPEDLWIESSVEAVCKSVGGIPAA